MRRSSCLFAATFFATSLTVSGQQPADTVSAPVTRSTPARANTGSARSLDPRILPGTKESSFVTIKGNALDSTGASLPNSSVRLRNARSGRIVAEQVTDNSGMFTFQAIDPGSYIVEVMGQGNHTVMAASQLLNVNAGEAVSAIVKLPFRISPFAGFLGHTTTSAATVAASAASAGVLAVTANECASPPCRQ